MNRVALVTGASRGLGRELAGFLVGQGYRVVATARGPDELAAAVHEWSPQPGTVSAIAGDVARPDHRAQLAEACRQLGGLDLLVNNASELGPSPMPPLERLEAEALRRILEVNLVAPVALIAATLPLLRARHGLVVNISSDAAVGAYPRWGGYGASKAALDLASRTLAAELREDGVSVVSVDPGDMRTTMQQAAFPGEDISDRPLPSVTIPFWAWLLGQSGPQVSGERYRAQADRWGVVRAA